MTERLSLDEALAMLPKEVREAFEDLPADEVQRIMEKLLVRKDIDFRPLVEKDLRAVKVRYYCKGRSRRSTFWERRSTLVSGANSKRLRVRI